MSDSFDIPICLIIFKRVDTVLRIIKRIECVKPSKIYLLGDQGRNDEERDLVRKCREAVEAAITWPCQIEKYYAENNRGVYENIAGGAKYVFSKEKWAIFLEDDNLPAVSFFNYCKELLEKYESDNRVLWICGTNYLEKYKSSDNCSYVFTRHMLPCGWASWANKFISTYDGDLVGLKDDEAYNKLKKQYDSMKLFKQQFYCFRKEYNRKCSGKRYNSWDYQMAFSIRYYDKLGISPTFNQIENIGVDNFSEHGGNSWKKTMTSRFCGIPTHEIAFPLTHPTNVSIDPNYEHLIDKIITNDPITRFKHNIKCFIFKLIKLDDTLSYKEGLEEIKKKKSRR